MKHAKRFSHLQSGFSLPEVMLAIGALVGVAFLISTLTQSQRQSQKLNEVNSTLASLRENLLMQINDQSAWNVTKAKNGYAMGCSATYPSTCQPGQKADSIVVYTANGTPLSAFSKDGTPCSSSGQQLDPYACPYRVNVGWQIRCAGTSCNYPEELVTVTFQYTPPRAPASSLNLSKFNVPRFSRTNTSDNNSPVITCADRGEWVFIGFNAHVANGDGVVTNADAHGCVPLIAFKGKTGPAGVPGDKGDRGPRGPAAAGGGLF